MCIYTYMQIQWYVQTYICVHIGCKRVNVYIHNYTSSYMSFDTGWRRHLGYLKLPVIFCKRATKYRALLRKMTCKDKASYESPPPCTCVHNRYIHNLYIMYISIMYIYVYIHNRYIQNIRVLVSHDIYIHDIHVFVCARPSPVQVHTIK